MGSFFSSRCVCQARLEGKTAIVTGANTGIGKSTVEDFYKRGSRVIVACRNLDKARKAVNDIKDACRDEKNLGTLLITKLDLSSLKSVRECADSLLNSEKRIDLLVNNAGVMMCPELRTEDGFEMQIGTNHLGHFLFTMLLLPRIVESGPARIVNVSSRWHQLGGRIDLDDLNWEKKKYRSMGAYQQSKLANILFTKELDAKLKENELSNITTYSLHPGVIKTELGRHLTDKVWYSAWLYENVFSWFLKTPEQGAQTTIYCSVDESCANQSGFYYAECAVKKPANAALNREDAMGLWELSWKLVGLPEDYNPFRPIQK